MSRPALAVKPVRSPFWTELARLGLVIGLEKRLLVILVSYAVAIGIFSLVVPLTVQELTNTFVYAIEPIMIVTFALIMLIGLLFIGFFRVFQTSTVETLFQRLYVRIAIAMTEHLPRIRQEAFTPAQAYRFMEAELLARAIIVVLVDVINVLVSGLTGMTILVFYHPNFLVFNAFLLGGFVLVAAVSGQGEVQATKTVSEKNYAVMTWIQDIASNRLHFKASRSAPFLLGKTDDLLNEYLAARRVRANILTWRQYRSIVVWEALCHSGMIALGGWLLSAGQITLGQFVAAEVIVGTLLLNLDTVTRRIYAMTYVLTSLSELDRVFALPKHEAFGMGVSTHLPDPAICGVRLTCKDVAFAYPNAPPVVEHFNVEIAPGEKLAALVRSSTQKTTVALVLAGLYRPTAGVVRYNDVDLREVAMDYINGARGLVLDSQPTLFAGTLEENITLGRSSIRFEDLRWAIRFVELEDEIDRLPRALETRIDAGGTQFTKSQILRVLVARAIVTRPPLLIFDGTLHNVEPAIRQVILRRLCSKEESWSAIFISNDHTIKDHVDRCVIQE
ncbi:ATP-binding cassette domain-containing protein [Nitrospira sp. NS4]|uniref:ATP-binding cassette domain-containing protein n=1 Tax=Nitrospira sp. NS4 TaxID=3414498 RepID=UPI003C308A75